AMIVGCPSMQLGLDLQYPCLRLARRRPRRARVHRRPPGLPVPNLQACWPPSPCGRLSRPRTTTRPPSSPGADGRRQACPSPVWTTGGEGGPRSVPTFTTQPVGGGGDQLCPCSIAMGTPQAFPMASWPEGTIRLPSRPTSWDVRCKTGPNPPGLGAGNWIEELWRWFLSYTFPPCLPSPGRLAVPARLVVVRAAPAPPCASKAGLPSASTPLLRQRCAGLLPPSRSMVLRGARPPHLPPGALKASVDATRPPGPPREAALAGVGAPHPVAAASTEQSSSDKRRERVMDHPHELDMIVVDVVLDKVEVVLGLVDRAGQELNDALSLEPGSDGLTHIE